jgi:hypothetical protein
MNIKAKFLKLLVILILILPCLPSGKTGDEWFTTGQDGDILLSGIDFNKTGGPLLFNHPGNIATDGTRLLLTDTYNNRVLIWNTIPSGNVEPDLVLGQDNFYTNNPGKTLNRLNWPVGVSTAEGKVVVADTENDRILIWNTFPTSNGEAADLSITFDLMRWPWAVWTNGTKLVVTATQGASVLIWKIFPTENDQRPDLFLRGIDPVDGSVRFGTPRSIGTDGETYLVIGDHNVVGVGAGNFFWNSFPTVDNQPYDFFMANPRDPVYLMWGGIKTSSGKFITLATPFISIWNSVPTHPVEADLSVGRFGGYLPETWGCNEKGYYFHDGDGSGLAVTLSEKLFISLGNGNMVVVFNSLPTSASQCPDFAIGSPDISTYTTETNYIISNGLPATDGKSLFVSSDSTRLYIWKVRPSKSGTHPDIVYNLHFPAVDRALYGNTYVLAGGPMIQIWTSLPRNGEPPNIIFDGKLGPVIFQDIKGVALDDKYLYVADRGAGKLYVWSALPTSDSPPLFSLDIPEMGRISSDGNYLGVISGVHHVVLYRVDGLSESSSPVALFPPWWTPYGFNLPGDVLVADNHLFIADTGNSRVFAWKDIQEAINGNNPDVVLGQPDINSVEWEIGVNRLFMPGGIAFHRNRLWAGEAKFSNRIVGFSFPLPSYILNISAEAGGTTDPEPGTYTYENGKEVTITAKPDNGYAFSNWNCDASGQENPIKITMDSDKYITANFVREYKLVISTTEGGTTDPSPGTHAYVDGTEVSIKAEPESGYKFSEWSGDASGSTNPITITMDKDKSIIANFVIKEEEKGRCFIATAAYGSPFHPHVRILRNLRDNYLVTNKIGHKLVDIYYKYSPFAAEVISKHKVLRIAVRAILLPFVVFSEFVLHFGPPITTVVSVFIFVVPISFIWFYRKRARNHRIK